MNDPFEKLCHFDVNTDTYGTELRHVQDKIAGGIVSSTNEYDLLLQKVNQNNNDLSCLRLWYLSQKQVKHKTGNKCNETAPRMVGV